MFKIKSFLLAVCTAISTLAIADKEPQTDEFEVDGLKVILRHSVKGTISARLFVMGGTSNYSKDKEGIESLALNLVMQSGPESMTKESFNAAAEKIGARLNANAGYDYSNFSLTAVKMYWDESWNLFSKAITNPAWRQDEYEVFRDQLVTASKQSISNPDAQLGRLAMSKAWEGTDYQKFPSGSPDVLESLTLEDVKNHYQKVVTRKNTFLVVVGDISVEDLKAKVEASLAKLPEGKTPKKLKGGEKVSKGLYVEDRKIETNYIKGIFDAPDKGTDESVYNSLAFSILYDRFFEELRTKRSLSYAPSARATGYNARPMNEVYISTTDPKASLEVMVDLLNKAKKEGIDADELKGKKQSFLTSYYMGQETNNSIAMSLGINEIRGDWRMADAFTETVLNAELEDLNRVLREYGDEIFWTYLGKEELVEKDDFAQPVKPEKLKD